MEGGGYISEHLTCTDAKAQSPCNYSKRQRKNTDRRKNDCALFRNSREAHQYN